MDENEARRLIKDTQYAIFDAINPLLVALERAMGRPVKDISVAKFQGGKDEVDRYTMVRATIEMEDIDWNLKA